MTWTLTLLALLLPWLSGTALLYCAASFTQRSATMSFHTSSAWCWRLGAGAFLGYWLTTLLMRALDALHIPFSLPAIALPLAIITLAAGCIAHHRVPLQRPHPEDAAATVPTITRYACYALLAWIALRFGLLLVETATRPLFPWEASLHWASKAHVYFGIKSLAPFVDGATWLSTANGAYFDNAPALPATLPLLQAWMCIAIGEWNDVLMNLPWWAMLLALALAVYGTLRSQGVSTVISLIAVWIITSLPLLGTHAALAGLPDLPLAGAYTLAALSLIRWARQRQWLDLAGTCLFALVAATLWPAAYAWLALLVPALIGTLLPKTIKPLALISLAGTVLGLLVLSQSGILLPATRIPFALSDNLSEQTISFFLDENWHLLGFATLALPLLAFRRLFATTIAPMTLLLITCALLSIAIISIPALADTLFLPLHTMRCLLYWTPLLIVWFFLLWRELTLDHLNT